MGNKKIIGILGMLVGGFWLILNVDGIGDQGIMVIAMPLIVAVLGAVFFFWEE